MSYRTIKRVLGESSLERKCRILFGVCLFLLIFGAFWGADRYAEDLVKKNTRSKASNVGAIIKLKAHIGLLRAGQLEEEITNQVTQELLSDVKTQAKDHSVVLADDVTPWLDLNPVRPADRSEAKLIRQLEEDVRQRERARTEEQQETATVAQNEVGPPTLDMFDTVEDDTPFAERWMPSAKEYHYYEPIRFTSSCRNCHFDTVVTTQFENFSQVEENEPLYVMKVVLPYRDTQDAINRVRAILIAVAIVTVFLSMVALYVIVRYVIVKPLRHLRDVSDDISRGRTELRADLNTGDEFEELAASFNRMLRHLTDAQVDLREANHELDDKVDELAQANMKLYEMNQLKSEFLANMSHELRTPLNSIIGFSEVLAGITSLDDKQKRYANNIQKSGRLLLEMINDILDLAKMEAGKMEVRPTEFKIDTVVAAQCDMVRSLTEEKNIDLDVRVPDSEPPMYQDQVKIQQILTNLLSNAIKFTPEGGRIIVTVRRTPEDRMILAVQDTGVGITADDRDVIFEKFRQGLSGLGDSLTRQYSGTGLGLSIVKELCKLLGGEVTFESEVGKGSTFRVNLPWTRADQPRRDSEFSTKLDEITKPKKIDFTRVSNTPSLPTPLPAGISIDDDTPTKQ